MWLKIQEADVVDTNGMLFTKESLQKAADRFNNDAGKVVHFGTGIGGPVGLNRASVLMKRMEVRNDEKELWIDVEFLKSELGDDMSKYIGMFYPDTVECRPCGFINSKEEKGNITIINDFTCTDITLLAKR